MDLNNAKLISSKRIDLPGQGPGWEVILEIDNPFPDHPSGLARTKHVHHFPDNALMWRAAEYEIDPDNIDTLLDLILSENHIRSEDVGSQTALSNTDVATARAHHVRRCAEVKLRHRLSTRENKSTLRVKAANPQDTTTEEDVEAPHPLALIRSHFAENPLDHKELDRCRKVLQKIRAEIEK